MVIDKQKEWVTLEHPIYHNKKQIGEIWRNNRQYYPEGSGVFKFSVIDSFALPLSGKNLKIDFGDGTSIKIRDTGKVRTQYRQDQNTIIYNAKAFDHVNASPNVYRIDKQYTRSVASVICHIAHQYTSAPLHDRAGIDKNVEIEPNEYIVTIKGDLHFIGAGDGHVYGDYPGYDMDNPTYDEGGSSYPLTFIKEFDCYAMHWALRRILTPYPKTILRLGSSGSGSATLFLECKNLKTVANDLFINYGFKRKDHVLEAESKGLVVYEPETNIRLSTTPFEDDERYDLSGMFLGCISLEAVPERLFSPFTEARICNECFLYCIKLSYVPGNIFEGCDYLTSAYKCFSYCLSLKEIGDGLFADKQYMSSFGYTFQNCESLQQIPPNTFRNCSRATYFQCTFVDCLNISTIPSGLFDDCCHAWDFSGCFKHCQSLREVPAMLFYKCTEAYDFGACFMECTALTTVGGSLFRNDHGFGDDFEFNYPSTLPENCRAVSSHSRSFWAQCFTDETTLKNYILAYGIHPRDEILSMKNRILENKAQKNVRVRPRYKYHGCLFDRAFNECVELDNVPNIIGDVDAIESCMAMFAGCVNLSSIAEFNFVANNCPDMVHGCSGMFSRTKCVVKLWETWKRIGECVENNVPFYDSELAIYGMPGTVHPPRIPSSVLGVIEKTIHNNYSMRLDAFSRHETDNTVSIDYKPAFRTVICCGEEDPDNKDAELKKSCYLYYPDPKIRTIDLRGAPIVICPNCHAFYKYVKHHIVSDNHELYTLHCSFCGAEFQFDSKIRQFKDFDDLEDFFNNGMAGDATKPKPRVDTFAEVCERYRGDWNGFDGYRMRSDFNIYLMIDHPLTNTFTPGMKGVPEGWTGMPTHYDLKQQEFFWHPQ